MQDICINDVVRVKVQHEGAAPLPWLILPGPVSCRNRDGDYWRADAVAVNLAQVAEVQVDNGELWFSLANGEARGVPLGPELKGVPPEAVLATLVQEAEDPPVYWEIVKAYLATKNDAAE